MVGKKSMPSCSDLPKRVIPELALANRPKRNISPKNLDNDTGLSWREERDLNRALYASLLESRRISREDEGGTNSGIQDQDSRQSVSSRSSVPCQFDDGGSVSQDSFRSMASTAEEKKQIKAPPQKKIHAQRKFAQGSLPPTPSTTPLKPKFKTSPVKVFPQRPRTEDFLTYLCFRGTNILPAFLDLANPTARVESCLGELSQADTPSRMTRESSPTSSSTSMSQNGDSVDLPVLTPHSQTPTRRAARASAGTPETARGFAGLRSSVSKKSPALSKTPLPKGRRFSGSTGQGRYSNGFYPPPPKLALAVGMKKSCGKAGVSDRLALKKKAMATLAAVRHSPKKPLVKKSPVSRRALSDSSLPRSQSVTRSKSASGILSQNKISRVTKIESIYQNGKGSSLRRSDFGRVGEKESATKRKSTSEYDEKFTGTTPPKKLKLRTSKRVKELIKKRDKVEGFSVDKKRIYAIEKDFHPMKKYTTKPFLRTVRSKGPVTRASTHIRKALASAKKMASKKLKLLKQSCQNTEMPRLVSEKEQQHQEKLTRLIKKKRAGIEKTHSSSADNSLYRYQTVISSPEGIKKGEERRRSEGERVFKVELFPQPGDPAAIIACPVFYPTEEEFRDPIGYIQSIQATAEHYGMCKIVPPNSWKMESKVNEEVRFTSQIQYIHKLHHRWGPAAIKIECIKRRFEAASSEKFQLPHIGGTELDLVRLHKVIRNFGGVQNVIEKKKWVRVADTLKIPKQSQDRVTKLYDAYCKYLVPFDTLTQEEVQKLEQSVTADRMKQEKSKTLSESCTSRGRSQTMGAFSRTARNIQIMYGSDVQASPEQIEVDYWKLVEERTSHVAVQCCKLDTSIHSSMFPIKRDNPYSRHPWNLHNFVQVRSNLLHHLGLVADVTVPTLHVKMLYSTDCWSADNHYLPYIQYHHQGADLIWYAVPEKEEDQFKSALREEVGSLLRDGGKWLPMDSVMVPPKLLLDKNVSLSRCVQHAGEFVVVFPKAYTANFSCGFALSESINFATQDWIPHGFQAALDLCASQDPEQFSMDAMLVFLARDPASSKSCLSLILPYLEQVVKKELEQRQQLIEAGLKSSERIQPKVTKTGHKTDILEEIHICDVSGKICYLSMVLNDAENSAFCLEQGLTHIQKKRNLKNCKLMYRFTESELKNLVRETKEKVGTRDSKESSKELRESTRELRESTREIRESVRETRESRASKEFTRDTRETTRELKETNRETKESSRETRESKEILERVSTNSPTSPKKKSLRKSESCLKPSIVEKT